MKRYKRVLFLAAALVVACIATFAMSQYEQRKEQIRMSSDILLQIPSREVLSLSWEHSGGNSLAFSKADGTWRYQDDEAFPVSEEKILDILGHFEEYAVSFVIENVTDYSQYGLDEPKCTLHLATGERSYDIEMGDYSKMDAQRYISIGDGNVYLVEEDPLDYVDLSLSDMILHDDTPGFPQVVDITFTGAENYTITRNDHSTDTYAPEDDIYFVERDGVILPLDTPSVRVLLNTITALDLLTYASYNVSQEELTAFGLDDPMLSVTVNYTYTGENDQTLSDTCVIHIGENPEERANADKQLEEDNTAGSVTRYVRIGDSQIVYIMDSSDFAILTAVSYDDLRHDEVFWADFKTVTRIDVALEGEAHSILSRPDDEEETAWYYGDTRLEIGDLQDALQSLTASSFTDELPDKSEEIGLTIHLDNESFPTVEVHLYRYDGSMCLAVVDGTPVSLVSRSCVMDLVEAVQAIVLN